MGEGGQDRKDLAADLLRGSATAADIRKFEALGTRSFPIEQGIGEAINFHEAIGVPPQTGAHLLSEELLGDASARDAGREAAYVARSEILVRDLRCQHRWHRTARPDDDTV